MRPAGERHGARSSVSGPCLHAPRPSRGCHTSRELPAKSPHRSGAKSSQRSSMSTPSVLSTIDKKFIMDRQGKSFVLYAGLLDLAHRSGLKRITTTLLQAPSPENQQTAICHAVEEMDRGVFGGIGDANPANAGKMIAMHAIRMGETRAKARALRDALNVGGAAYEELGRASC